MAAISTQGLVFFPLYWVMHDSWKFITHGTQGDHLENHWGHVHFFMLGFDPVTRGGDAFGGRSNYHFEIKDEWGPRSQDPNQQFQYQVIGTPRWYFHVTELWRRVYVQPWDMKLSVPDGTIVGRKGVKYDASQRGQTFGPFREGRNYAPVFIDGARTLPLEYYTTETKDRLNRDHYVKDKYRQKLDPATFGDGSLYDIPADGSQPGQGSPGGVETFPDGVYISPTLEYQKVVQLNWERLPGYQAAHDVDDNNFGDGWPLDVTVPFTNPQTGTYRSPFTDTPGTVFPPGQYFNNLVSSDNKLKFRAAELSVPQGYDYVNRPFGLTAGQSGQPLTYNNPYGVADGTWVQQCLGGIVQAKARVTIESSLGGRQDVWVETTQLIASDKFAGTDQLLGAS